MKMNIHQFSNSNSIRLIRSGTEYFSELEKLIESAQQIIHLQVYIFSTDRTGLSVINKLKAAAQRGVKVYIVVDAYASPHFTPALIQSLKSEGVFVKPFAPLHFRKLKIGRRLHHKIVLIDNQKALIGGINIADKYHGINYEPWLDVAVEVTGTVCKDLEKICSRIWPSRIRKHMNHHVPSIKDEQNVRLRVIQTDWWRKRIAISRSYNNAFRRSKQNITIVASYFLPGRKKRNLLTKAAQRGIHVTVITGGFSDVPLLKPAIEYLYKTLLQSGIRIFEWNKSVLHAKFATVDSVWVTVGSYNLNALSDYGSIEANIESMDPEFALATEAKIKDMIEEGCTEINADIFVTQSNIFKQAYRWACYVLMRSLLALLFMAMRKDYR
jgi:cardiolipin synthase